MCSARRTTFGPMAGFSLCVVMGCGSEADRPRPPDDVVYADNVTIITSESSLRLESIDATTMRFAYTGSAPGIAPGDIVSGSSTGSADGAYLRRVDSIDELGDNTLVIRTSQATVDDAVEEGHFEGKILINPPAGTAAGKEQVLMQIGASGTIDVSGELFNNGLLSVDIPSGTVGISAEIDWDVDYSFFGGLDSFSVTFDGSSNLDLDVTVSTAASGYFEHDVELLRLPPEYFLVGIIAGQVNVIFEAGIQVDASAAGTVETGLDAYATVNLGGYYQGGDWSTSYDRSTDFNSHGWEWNLEGTVGARVFVRPKVEILFYYVAGPVFDLEPYLAFDAWFQECYFDWALTGGVSSHLGIDLGPLSELGSV